MATDPMHGWTGSGAPRATESEDRRGPRDLNRLLSALPAEVVDAWGDRLEPVELEREQVLIESGAVVSQAWFPTTAVVSMQYLTEDGHASEVAVVGSEGLIGIPLFMGGGSTPGRAVVAMAGQALRLPGVDLRNAFRESLPVMAVLLRYTQALIAHMAQTAVCNRHHAIEQQLSRWLLLMLDRHEGEELRATQEQIALMLGVRREGVTEAALHLQRDGLIRYQRGHIHVLDRTGLQLRCCECYAIVKAEYDRLLPAPSPDRG